MIIRQQSDQENIDEIISERAKVNIKRTAPWRFAMTITENGEVSQFAYRSSDDETPLRMSVETDAIHHSDANTVDVTGSLHSEQMAEDYYWIGVRAGTHEEHEVTVHVRSATEGASPITCEVVRKDQMLTPQFKAQAEKEMKMTTNARQEDANQSGSLTIRGVCTGPDDEHFCDLDTPCLHDCGDGCHEAEAAIQQPPGPNDLHYLNDGCDAPHGRGIPPFDASTG